MRKILAIALALCALCPPAGAQNAITQEGTVLQNSPMMFRGNNRARQGAPVQGAPSGQIVTTGDAVVGGRCDYSAPTDASDGYYRLCLDSKTGTIRLDGTKLPPLSGIKIDINGTIYEMPFSIALVGSDAIVSNNANLKLVAGTVGKRLTRLGFSTIGDGGLSPYNWSASNCTAADDGAQVQPTGVTGCWVADFSAQRPIPEIWGAKGDGTTDDTVAVQAALNARAGQYLWQGDKSSYHIAGITIPNGTSFKGTFANSGAPNYHNTYFNFANSPAIRLDAASTITTLNGSTLDGLLIYRYGMIFPAANSSAFAGTAISVSGDSFTLKNSMVIGFDLAVNSGFGVDGRDKGLIENTNFDNQSNIRINGAADTWKIHNIHAWPWASFTPTGTGAAYYRTGINFYQSNSNDASLISDYLAFGYKTSFAWNNVGGSTCTNCDADGDEMQPDVVAFSATGTTENLTLLNPKIFARRIGVYINTTGTNSDSAGVTIIGGTIAAIQAYGVQVDTSAVGTLQISNTHMRNVNYAMQVLSPNMVVSLNGGNHIGSSLQDVPINVPLSSANVFVGPDNILGDPVTNAGRTIMSTNASVPLLTISGGSLSLPPTGNIFQVADGGTAAFVNSEWAGRTVTLVFKGITTLQHTGAGGFGTLRLNGSANFVSAANSTLTLSATGGTPAGWLEIGRMKP